MRGSPVRVLCVDDHHLVRECVVAVIAQEPDLRLAAEAWTVEGALDGVTRARPDVILVSLRPAGLDTLQVIRAIRRADPRARIVVYARDETDAVHLALDAGATGFVLNDAAPGDLVRVITEVHSRNGVLLNDVRRKLEARGSVPALTIREIEILELLTQGQRTKAISATLGISAHTVRAHLKSVYTKLGVHDRAAAVAEALRRGYVQLGAPAFESTAWPPRGIIAAAPWPTLHTSSARRAS